MFPWVYEFHWTIGHILFLSLFFGVVAVIAISCVRAGLSAARDIRKGNADAIRWHGEFEELPHEARPCRHELSGEIRQRTCVNGFACSSCSFHRDHAAHEVDRIRPGERLYHRGHTWVSRNDDGVVTIGLDEIGRRLLGDASGLELPVPGAHVDANAVLGKVARNGASVRILSPVTGEVVERIAGIEGHCLRVRPSDSGRQFESLLRETEAEGWMIRERERLELSLSHESGIAALADGGEIVEDLGGQLSDRERSRVLGEFFLDF